MSKEYINGINYKLNEPQKVENICGLYAWKITKSELVNLQKDCEVLFTGHKPKETKNRRRRMSKYIELGNSFISTEEKKNSHFKFIEPSLIEELNILKFIFNQTNRHSDDIIYECVRNNFLVPSTINFNFINVIIREYYPGQGIGFHIDRAEKLDGMIWSCIIDCGSPTDGLHYQLEDTSGNNIEYPFLEKSGCVSVQTGPARYLFKHGIHKINSHRISITWRFFKPDYLTNVNGYSKTNNSYLNTLQKRFEYNKIQEINFTSFYNGSKLWAKENQSVSELVHQTFSERDKSNSQNNEYTLFPNSSLFLTSVKSDEISIAQETALPIAKSFNIQNIDTPKDINKLDCTGSYDLSNNYFQENKMTEVLKKCNLKNYKDTYTKLINEDVELEQLHSFNLKDFHDVDIDYFDALKIIAFFNHFT